MFFLYVAKALRVPQENKQNSDLVELDMCTIVLRTRQGGKSGRS